MKNRSGGFAFLTFLFSVLPVAWGADGDGFDSITQADLMRHIRFLADDKLEGRESGGPGNLPATKYVAAEFQRYGLKPASAKQGFLQPFEITLNPEFSDDTGLTEMLGGTGRKLRLGEDFLPFDNLDSAEARGSVVFAGYGISAAKEGYDDYDGISVSNKIVLVLRKAPRDGDTNGLFRASGGRPNHHALFTTKLEVARKHGAIGIFVVDATAKRQTVKQLAGNGPFRMGPKKESLPYSFVSYMTASNWLAAAGRELRSVVNRIDKLQQPDSFPIAAVTIDLRVKIRREKATVSNVVGLLEGSDPELKGEYLVIGGHFDHVGYGRDRRNAGKSEFIHNGADDNASGTSAVLELAQAFAGAKSRPRRSILFMGFNAEERGLLGSRHYVEKPFIPLSNTVAMINLDMVGRGASGLDVGGVGTSPGFAPLVKAMATNYSFKLTMNPGGKAPSDNTSFYNKGMPVLFFYTGRHDDYHKPSDDADKINGAEIEQVTRMAFQIANEIANADERPKFTKSDGNPVRRGRPRVLLGVVMDGESNGMGVRVREVAQNSPAGRAGIRPGDVIEQLGGRPMANVNDVTRSIAAQRPGGRLEIRLRRQDEAVVVEVRF